MAALFDGSTGYLENAAPNLVSTGFPLTMACWFRPTATPGAPSTICTYMDTAVANPPRMSIQIDATYHLGIFARDSAGTNLSTTGATSNGSWAFVVARFINATNRRLSVLFPDGSLEHIQSTTSRSPTGLDAFTVGTYFDPGPTLFGQFPGLIGEFWYADADVQADGAQLSDATLRQLAFCGPFSLSFFRKSLVEYHGMNSSLPSVRNAPHEHYVRGALSSSIWTKGGTVTLGHHPPLPARYETPRDTLSLAAA